MEKPAVDRNKLVLALLAAILFVILFNFKEYADRRSSLVFCDVGQGDAAYIKIDNGFDVLIDAGPDRKILDCLGKYMSFIDRKIEIIFISHPDKDHYGGLEYIIPRYNIGRIITPDGAAIPAAYSRLLKSAAVRQIIISRTGSYKSIKAGAAHFYILNTLFPVGSQNDSDNAESIIILYRNKGRSVLFTGDSNPSIINPFLIRWIQSYGEKITILKVPHHGSQQAISAKLLRLAGPTLAVISCGLHNSYGHPAAATIALLKAQKIKISRTDLEGDIEFRW